jgi:hypothetical protein
MTDLQVHARSGIYSFDQDVLDCSNEVQRLNPHIYNKTDEPHMEDSEA